MKTFEIRANDGLTVILPAEDEDEALAIVTDEGLLSTGATGSVTEYDGRPVGADGSDPEEPEEDVNEPLHDPRGPYPV